MSQSILIQTALRLPAPDVEALIQGRMIAAIPRKFIEPGRSFALYPADIVDLSINLLPHEQHYRSNFLPTAKSALTQINSKMILLQPEQLSVFAKEKQLQPPLLVSESETVLIKAWARCERCKSLNDPESLENLSQLTVWTTEALQQTLLPRSDNRSHIFVAHLRVYRLTQPIKVPVNSQGHFVPLPAPLNITEFVPVLSDSIFAKRQHQLKHLLPVEHPELEQLQGQITQLAETNSAAKALDQEIKIFLGWSEASAKAALDPDLVWIQTIAQVGNSSDGHAFEKLVRRALLKLGFQGSSLKPDSTGGAGGMDFYCEMPYPMVGECKATKTETVSDGTPAQLLKIGMNHLGKEQYERSIKLIVAAGDLTSYALRTATENFMNVIRPETLQRLVELEAQHKNSVNLLELKKSLQQAPFGLADDKVNYYLDKVRQDINLRSYIIQLVKRHLEETNDEEDGGVKSLNVAYRYSTPPQPLTSQEMYEILIELSSPLTGYLGRVKGSDWENDRFYFLREMPAAE